MNVATVDRMMDDDFASTAVNEDIGVGDVDNSSLTPSILPPPAPPPAPRTVIVVMSPVPMIWATIDKLFLLLLRKWLPPPLRLVIVSNVIAALLALELDDNGGCVGWRLGWDQSTPTPAPTLEVETDDGVDPFAKTPPEMQHDKNIENAIRMAKARGVMGRKGLRRWLVPIGAIFIGEKMEWWGKQLDGLSRHF